MPENEQDLIRRWKNGDKKAFGELVRQYMSDAYLIALGFARNSDDARDLSQDAFIRAYEARAQFEEGRPFYPWFYRILRNRCLNFVSREKKKSESLYYENNPSRERFASGGPTALEKLERKERARLLHAALDRLSFDHKEVIVMKNFKGNSYEEMSRVLCIPIGTVMSRLYYARKMLKDILVEMEQHGLAEKTELVPVAHPVPGEVT